MGIPIECSPNHNVEADVEDDFIELFQDLDEIIVDDELKNLSSPESDESGFGFDTPYLKRKAYTFCDLSFDFFSNVDGDNGDEEVKLEVPECPDWLSMTNFEREVTEDGNPVPRPPTSPAEASGSESGFEIPLLPKRIKTNSGSGTKTPIEVGEGIVLALMAPQICPWRTGKGGIKRGRKPPQQQ